MTLTFDTLLTSLTHLVECFHHVTLRPMAAINSKKYIIFTYAHTKVTKFDLGVKWVKVNPGS